MRRLGTAVVTMHLELGVDLERLGRGAVGGARVGRRRPGPCRAAARPARDGGDDARDALGGLLEVLARRTRPTAAPGRASARARRTRRSGARARRRSSASPWNFGPLHVDVGPDRDRDRDRADPDVDRDAGRDRRRTRRPRSGTGRSRRCRRAPNDDVRPGRPELGRQPRVARRPSSPRRSARSTCSPLMMIASPTRHCSPSRGTSG